MLKTGLQTKQQITRADVAELNPINISLMPRGSCELLSKEKLADVVVSLQASQG